MRRRLLIAATAVTIAAGAIVILSSISAAQAPLMSGGYPNVIPIPIDEPGTKAIAGALIKPEGARPFPAIIYLGGCAPVGSPHDADLEKTVIDHYRATGFATLIVDSYTARHADRGMCDRPNDIGWHFARALDAHAAWKALAAMPDIDARRIFVQGYDTGANAAVLAVDPINAPKGEVKFAGVVAFYPWCDFGSTFSAPTLIMIGDKDELTPADLCQKHVGKTNVEVVVYPGATHYFATPGVGDFQGIHMAYDPKAAKDAQARADAFIAAHMK